MARVRIHEHELVAEVAATAREHARGLMYRLHLPPDAGMLFVLPADEPPAFWMRDTFIPLSLAFLDAEGTILSIVDLMPLDETMRVGPEAARYALEVNRGWFAERGIVPGARVELALDD